MINKGIVEEQIWFDICYKHFEKAKQALAANNVNVDFKFQNGLSFLHMAAKKGAIEVLQLLLEKGADINITDDIGNTPLMTAVYAYNFKDDAAIKLLLRKGARTDLKNSSGNDFAHFCKVKGYSLKQPEKADEKLGCKESILESQQPFINEREEAKQSEKFKLIIAGIEVMPFNKFTLSGEIRDWGANYQSYMILEPVESIQGSAFLQASINAKTSQYIVQLIFETGQNFTQYEYCTHDGGEVVKLFWEYYENEKLPNIQEWTDITEQLK